MKDQMWKTTMRLAVGVAMGLAAVGIGASAGSAQDAETGWADVAELTFVQTAGNASSSTFGLKNTLNRSWDRSAFQLAFGGVRTSSTQRSGEATGTAQSFTPIESSGLTAANYFVRSRYDRTLTESTYAFGGAGWDRNTFAGVENRYNLVSGIGRTWFEGEDRAFKTDVGVTYTVQNDVTPTPGADDGFLGLRASWDYRNEVTETTTLSSTLIVDENLNDTEDLRADFTNSIAVAISDGMALKASHQLLFDNQPSLESFTLVSSGTQVTRELETIDSVFTVALVVNF